MNVGEREALAALTLRLKMILPEEYQDSYESVQPVSMGSAGLKYGLDGKVAWNEIENPSRSTASIFRFTW